MENESMKVEEVAQVLHKSKQFVRIGLQRGLLPFGTAQQMPGSKKYTYYISKTKFYAFLGKEKQTNNEEPYKITEYGVVNQYGVIIDPYWKGERRK